MAAAVVIGLVVLYLLVHGHHYRKRRKRGLSVWASIPGPFGSRISRRF
jgi:hypothetical protein